MEYDYYLVQKYLCNGTVEAKELTASEAQALGYEDGYKSAGTNYTLYVNGFNSVKAVSSSLNDLVNCTLIS